MGVGRPAWGGPGQSNSPSRAEIRKAAALSVLLLSVTWTAYSFGSRWRQTETTWRLDKRGDEMPKNLSWLLAGLMVLGMLLAPPMVVGNAPWLVPGAGA